MEIVVGKYAGFCGGVKNAIAQAEKAVKENEIVYCLGEIVHNKQVVDSLKSKGLRVVNSINEVPNCSKMIIRAHGEKEEIYNIASEKNIDIIDATCGVVKSIHNKVKSASKDSFIILIGEKKHPETIGTAGFSGKNYYIVEEEADILEAYIEYEKTNLGKVYVCSQTTFNSKKFDELSKEIEHNFYEADVIVDKTICNNTEIRQAACDELSRKVDAMIVIGGKNSANTTKLVNISKNNNNRVFWIETLEDLKTEDLSNINKIGIMAGASTPNNIIEEVEEFLKKL